jgi:hypothetical protein
MKTRLFTLSLVMFFYCLSASGQTNARKANPVGSWKFEAPYAPEGYTSGTIEVGFTDNKYSASVSFTGSDYKASGYKVSYVNDSLFFLVNIEDQSVSVYLKMTSDTKMTGKSVYTEGEIPLSLTKSIGAGNK